MKIELQGDYVITSDNYTFILSKKSIVQSGKNKGEEILNSVGYTNSIEKLIWDCYRNKRILDNDAKSFKELVEHIKAIDEYVLPVMKSVQSRYELVRTCESALKSKQV